MTPVFINRIATAVPPHQVHEAFCAYAHGQLTREPDRRAFARLAERGQIEHRWSVLEPCEPLGSGTVDGFYKVTEQRSTGERMVRYKREAPGLAALALDRLNLAEEARSITHLVFATCTGFSAPGLDHQMIQRFGLPNSVERTIVGFMGCQAAINALKLAYHQVRSTPRARVLVLCLELCTLHLQNSGDMQQLLSALLFADGCAAALLSAEPTGIRVDGFHSAIIPTAADQITWDIGDIAFDMTLSGMVPFTLAHALPEWSRAILDGAEVAATELWAVHPGGRAILDAVAHGLELPEGALAVSRDVLRGHGNMSSATVMFVLERMMQRAERGQSGCALAFGPGLSAEAMRFAMA